MPKQDVLVEFEQFMRSMSRTEFAGLIYEYLIESNHQSWDGHKKRDLSAYRNLFRDIMIAHQAMVRDNPGHCNRDIFNGSEHYKPLEGIKARIDVYEQGRDQLAYSCVAIDFDPFRTEDRIFEAKDDQGRSVFITIATDK